MNKTHSSFLKLCLLLLLPLGNACGQPGGPIDVGYLVDSQFAIIDGKWDDVPNVQQGKISDWDVDSKAGTLTCYGWNYLLINDTDGAAAITMRKSFLPQTSGTVSVEFRFNLPTKVDGMTWSVRSDRDNELVTLTTQSGNLGYMDSTNTFQPLIVPYTGATDYTVHMDLNMTTKSLSTLSINGVQKVIGTGFFRNAALTQAAMFTLSTAAATGSMQLSYVTVTKGYRLFERFQNATIGLVPTGWTATTGNSVAAAYGCNKKDIASFKLTTIAATLSHTFPADTLKTVCEYKFMLPVKADGVSAVLAQGPTKAVTISTSGGALGYVSGGVFTSLWPNYKANVWYTIRLIANPANQKVDIYINGKLKGSQIAFAAAATGFDNIVFTNAPAANVCWLDDIYVSDFVAPAADYVPAVQPVVTTGYRVGVQTFFAGWREGEHVGWDWIYRHPNHDPFMGHSDGGMPETMDWQLKWMAEAGVNFFLDCWYKNPDPTSAPIKEPMADYTQGAINNGYFYAKYSDKVKFAIADYTLDATSSTEFINNIMPYWLEYYIKDPRYYVVPGSLKGYPVVSLGKATTWVNLTGNQMKNSIAALRAAVIADGYDGLIVLANYSGADSTVMNNLYAAGVNYCYAYWGTNNIANTQSKLAAQLNPTPVTVPSTYLLPIADAGMGQGGEAWDLVAPWVGNTSIADFKTQSKWMWHDFLPTPKLAGTLASQMVLYDNWNEFGEGHYICPTNIEGFGYLDEIRRAYTDAASFASVVDQRPNAAQRARMDVLYTRAWDGRSWGFDSLYADTEGWTINYQISAMAQNKGYLEGTFSGTDPSILSRDGFAIDASLNKAIKVRMKNTGAGTYASFYFITTTDGVYGATKLKTFPITPNDTIYREYTVDMTDVPTWTGSIRQLRFDIVDFGAVSGGTFSIDYIKVVSNGRGWEFNSPDSGTEGWGVLAQINSLALNSGNLEGALAGSDPTLLSPDNCSIDASLYKKIRIRMKNSTTGTAAKLYFITTTDGVYSETKAKPFPITANDPGYTEYVVDLTAMATWTGTIRRLRLDPVDVGASAGTFSIDYIRVGN